MFKTRLLSGIVLVAIAVASVAAGGPVLFAVLLAISLIGVAYTEFYFTDVAWPDFDKKEFEKAIDKFNHRDRRYGGVKED